MHVLLRCTTCLIGATGEASGIMRFCRSRFASPSWFGESCLCTVAGQHVLSLHQQVGAAGHKMFCTHHKVSVVDIAGPGLQRCERLRGPKCKGIGVAVQGHPPAVQSRSTRLNRDPSGMRSGTPSFQLCSTDHETTTCTVVHDQATFRPKRRANSSHIKRTT